MTVGFACPGCANSEVELVYQALSVPVHDVILHHTRAEALGYPKGDINLGFCPECGLIFQYPV